MKFVKGSKIFKIIMPALLIIALLASFMGASTAVLADSLPSDNLVVGGQYEPGTQGTELDIMINGGPAQPGWCVNEHVNIYVNTQYPVEIYDYREYFGESYPTNIGLLPAAVITNTYSQTVINWPAIAYIINHKAAGASFMDIQKAMWYFSDNDASGLSTYTQTMVDAANSYLETHNGVYIPVPGQLEPVICYVPGTTSLQVIFYEDTLPAMPDLIITSVTTTADPDDPTWYSVSFTIKNQGTAEASASVASIEVDGGEISNPSCPALAVGESAVVTVPSGELADTADTDTIKVIADINQTVVESNESNNASAIVTYSIFTIAASSGANGSITPSGNIMVGQETNRSFSIEANAGYHIADVLVDGISFGSVTSYTFNNVIANHSIAAAFAANQYSVTFNLGTHGTLTSGELMQSVNYGGDAVAPVVTPNANWTFSGWDNSFSNVSSHTIVNAQYSADNTLSMVGTEAMTSIMQAASPAFNSAGLGVTINSVTYNDSTTGINEVLAGNCDVALSSRPLTAEEETLLNSYPIARDAMTIIVNRSVPSDITQLTLPQLKGIYEGTYTNWNQVGSGVNMPIALRALNIGSGIRESLNSICDINESLEQATITASRLGSDIAMQIAINAADGALGYVTMGYGEDPDYPNIREIRIVNSEDGIPYRASLINNLSGKYPLAYFLYLVTEAAADSNTALLINWMTQMDGEGQSIVLEAGKLKLIPDQDINADNQVNYLDLGILGTAYGKTPVVPPRADIIRDGTANYLDLGELGNWYGIQIQTSP